jgi:hypothetical protein
LVASKRSAARIYWGIDPRVGEPAIGRRGGFASDDNEA